MSTIWPSPVRSAVVESREDPDHREHAGGDVPHRGPHPGGSSSRMAGEAHQPAHRLHDHVVGGPLGVGAGPPEPAHRRVHQLGPALVQHLPPVAHPLQGAGPEVLHQHVRLVQQGLERHPIGGVRKVEGHGRLAPVQRLEVDGAVPDEGTEPPGVVPRSRTFHLDHPSPEVGQQHRGVGTGQHTGQVNHRYVGERTAHAG